MKLYDIDNKYREWAEKVAEQEGEIFEEDLTALEENEISFEQKADNYAALIKEIEAEVKCLNEAIAAQKKRVERKETTIKYLRQRLITSMELRGQKKLETLNAVISISDNQFKTIIDDKTLIPEEYITINVKTERNPNLTAIKEAIKSGKEVPGAHLDKNIQIK